MWSCYWWGPPELAAAELLSRVDWLMAEEGYWWPILFGWVCRLTTYWGRLGELP